jgi:type IV pilus assembly protein PilE
MKHTFTQLAKRRRSAGFTLIEVLVTVAIVAILGAVAVPAYTEYVTRGKIPEATSTLASMRVQLEQYYQDNRNYGSSAAGCGVASPNGQNFTFSCNWGPGASNQSFSITATGVAGGPMSDFTYTIDQAGTRRTTRLPAAWGTAPPAIPCWVVKKGGGC